MDLGAAVVLAIFLLVAVLIFVSIYLFLPQDSHFLALLLIGVLSLSLAFGAYFAQALSADPIAQRSLAYGFSGMGFAILLLTLTLAPSSTAGLFDRIVGILVVLVLLGIAAAAMVWSRRSAQAERRREGSREAWRSNAPPSAFEYTTAKTNVPVSSPSRPAQGPPSPPSSGGS